MTSLLTPWPRRLLAALALSTASLHGCTEDPDPPPVTSNPPAPPGWEIIGKDLEAAVLSISGTSARDVWAVGAAAGPWGGLVARYEGSGWTRVDTGQPYDLWWVHAFAPDQVFFGGAGGTILSWDGSAFTRHRTPGLAAHTVYGVWGSAPDDVWAVGGVAGRYGFLWHYDGETWTDVPLPDDVPLDARGELPSLFKVWGSRADDVWAVGGNGLVLHHDGTAWSVIPSGTDAILFTVHGDEDRVVIVGGGAQGVLLEGTAEGGLAPAGPQAAPLLQGVNVAPDGAIWASGERGTIYRREQGGAWETIEAGLDVEPQSLHAIWVDPAGGVWSVGGGVLSPALDAGVIVHRGTPSRRVTPREAPPQPPAACPEDRIDIEPDGSMARRWNELLLDSIRRDIPKPTVHSRNLFHTSVAMYDAWATYDSTADGYVYTQRHAAADVEAAREISIAYAAYRVLRYRYANAVGGATSLACYDAFMDVLGLDPTDERVDGEDPVAIGNRIGGAVIAAFAGDGANEAGAYADTTDYQPVNPPCVVDQPGTLATQPSRWQELNLAQAETQNGIIVDSGIQQYIGPNWGYVESFALPPDVNGTGVHHDWADIPSIDHPQAKDWAVEVIRKTAWLDHTDGEVMDISPGGYGNNPLGTNDGTGHPVNPATGQPYAPNLVPRGDFARVLAEFWADGPKSETPPGHWNTLANEVSDSPLLERRLFGQGPVVDRLRWDVSMYFALNAAVHDAAITAWGLKRAYTTSRPITLIRYMAGKGQSSDPALPSYDPGGLPLVPGLIELIDDESAAPGGRHHHLRWWKGQVAVRAWRGEPGDRASEVGSIGWMRAVDWIPYQRRTFVTPAFPGFVSGHSTFSRAAAETLTAFTGSPYFPGGLGEFVAPQGGYLVFEDGPSVEVRLQWATYQDAADQAGQSRLYGGIHVWPDDTVGRQLGSLVGQDAAARARNYFEGTAVSP